MADRRGPGFGVVQATFAVALLVPQVVQVGHRDRRPAARTLAYCSAGTRAPECAAWPVRSNFHGPHRRWPAVRYRRGYSVAESGAGDRERAGVLRWPDSGRSAASPGPGSDRSSFPDSAAPSRAPCGLVWAYCCWRRTCSIQLYTCSRSSPSNRISPLAFRNASICSRFSFSASCMLVVNPQHATRSRLTLYWKLTPPSGSSCIGQRLGLDIRRRPQHYTVADLVQSEHPGMVRIWRLPFGLDI